MSNAESRTFTVRSERGRMTVGDILTFAERIRAAQISADVVLQIKQENGGFVFGEGASYTDTILTATGCVSE